MVAFYGLLVRCTLGTKSTKQVSWPAQQSQDTRPGNVCMSRLPVSTSYTLSFSLMSHQELDGGK